MDLITILYYTANFIIVLSAIVFIHEYGHYYVAKKCGVKIEAFSIGFGKEIFGWNDKTGTRWKISLLPLGGYVKMFGDMGPSSQADTDTLEKMSENDKKSAFHTKSLLQKTAIVAAGPLANFLLAIVVLTGLYTVHGKSYSTTEVASVVEESAAEEAGLLAGDRILSINSATTKEFSDVRRALSLNTGTPITITLERDGAKKQIELTPKMVVSKDGFGNEITVPQIGIQSTVGQAMPLSPIAAFKHAIFDTYFISASTLKAVGQMITGKRDFREISGPLGIAKYSGQAASQGLITLLWFVAVISINLGLINLFPIPVLDGGHLLYYAIEAVKGRPMAEKWQEFGFKLGLSVIAALAIFTIGNDIYKLF